MSAVEVNNRTFNNENHESTIAFLQGFRATFDERYIHKVAEVWEFRNYMNNLF